MSKRPPNEDEISLLVILSVFVKHKWIILLVVVLSTIASAIYAFTVTPVYRAEVLLAPVNKEAQSGRLASLAGQFGGLASMAGIDLGGGGSTKDTVIAILKSRLFTKNFIREKNLMPLLFDEMWDSKKKQWDVQDKGQIPSMWKAYRLFNVIRTVSEDKKTGLVTLAIEWKDPKLAANWANEIVGRLNNRLKLDAIKESDRNLAYLRKQLEKTDVVTVQQSMFGLIEAETKNAMLANVSDEYAFRIVDPAVAPEERLRPKRKMILIFGFMIGCVLGIFSAAIQHNLSKLK